MLEPDGFLLFSTLPLDAAGGPVADVDKKGYERGFLYKERNEKHGRLDGHRDGTASVSRPFVEDVVAASFDGRLVKYWPRELNGVQDIYLLQRAGVAR